MTSRPLTPNERMTDAFDRASTLNFTTVAHVRGPLAEAALRVALDRLGQKHPLLRAGIARAGKRSRFVAGAAAPIALVLKSGAQHEVLALAEQTLVHRDWSDEGPRAELTCVRHGTDSFSLLLCLHHVVSDGSSGILAMRDLLRLLCDASSSSEPVPSPGQNAFFPRAHGGLGTYLRALAMVARSLRAQQPVRLHERDDTPLALRAPHLARFRLPRQDSLALASRARRAGTTVHGVLCAATAQAIREQLGTPSARQRMLHPVCLRRYLRELDPEAATPGAAVGCYVSSVETNHTVDAKHELSTLAREISSSVQREKKIGSPLLTAPIAGPLLTDRFAGGSPAKLRELAENKLMRNTFSLTNLGKLEQLEVDPSIGTLTLDDLYFVAAGSVLVALGASATSYRDELSYQLVGTAPRVTAAQVNMMANRVEAQLREYARSQA